MQTSWPGHYYDGRTSTRHAVTVFLTPSGLEISLSDGSRIFWPYHELTQTQGGYEHEPARLERGQTNPASLVVEDPGFLPSMRTIAQREGRQFRGLREFPRGARVIVLAGVASLALLGALMLWGIPALAELVTPLVPTTWETALGNSVIPELAPVDLRCGSRRLRENVDQIVTRLAAAGPPTPYTFRVTIVESPVFNALAAPGGSIILFRPLVRSTETPEELAGVLAHEMQHVRLRHATKALVRDLSMAAIAGAVLGDVSGIGAFAVQAGRTLTTLHHSRGAEEEADREGMRLIQAAQIDPSGMIRFFETVKAKTANAELPGYLSTHPETDQRLARLKALAAEVPVHSTPLLPDGRWEDVKNLCQ